MHNDKFLLSQLVSNRSCAIGARLFARLLDWFLIGQ